MTHDQCRQKICLICIKKKACVRPINPATHALINSHISGLENYSFDPRLPNGICASCRQALQNPNKHHLLPEPQDYTKFTVNCPSPSSPHDDVTCYICKLARMNAVKKKQLASMVAAGKMAENVTLCHDCLGYRTEGAPHDCKTSLLPKDVMHATASQSQVIAFKSQAKIGTYSFITSLGAMYK